MKTSKSQGMFTARFLRQNQTDAETYLWSFLRNRKLQEIKFKRQERILYETETCLESFFVADFYCPKKKLVIELDGGIHQDQFQKDAERTRVLESLSYTVIRFKNEELERIEIVLKRILKSYDDIETFY